MKEKIEIILQTLIGVEIDSTGIEQRGSADKIELLVCETIKELDNGVLKVEDATSRRSMEDIQIVENNNTFKIDVKTHELDTAFSMPNLVSIDRLRKYLASDNNQLLYVFVDYKVDGNTLTIESIKIFYVEELDWNILAIQNLGKGQLQIKNMNNDLSLININREKWLETLTEKVHIYHEKLIEKIKKRDLTWL